MVPNALASLTLVTEQQVHEYLTEAFNLNVIGEVEDKGAMLEALMICSRVNAAIISLAQFQNAVMSCCNRT
jgi:hypothetical protein